MWYILVIVGFALIGIDIMLHGGHVGFFLIFPFLYGNGGILSIIGILLILVGFFLAPLWITRRAYLIPREDEIYYPKGEGLEEYWEMPQEKHYPQEFENKERRSSFGGVIFIGPFPIVFGGGEGGEIVKWTVIGAIAIGILMIVLVILYAIFGGI